MKPILIIMLMILPAAAAANTCPADTPTGCSCIGPGGVSSPNLVTVRATCGATERRVAGTCSCNVIAGGGTLTFTM